jgi:hypothetical protein
MMNSGVINLSQVMAKEKRDRLVGNFDWQLHIPRSAADNELVTYRDAKKERPRTTTCWAKASRGEIEKRSTLNAL